MPFSNLTWPAAGAGAAAGVHPVVVKLPAIHHFGDSDGVNLYRVEIRLLFLQLLAT